MAGWLLKSRSVMPVCCNHNPIRLGNRLTSSDVSFGVLFRLICLTLAGSDSDWTLGQSVSSKSVNIVFLLKSRAVTPLQSINENR